MKVSVTDAETQLNELVRRARAGDEVILTDEGFDAVRLVPVKPRRDNEALLATVKAIQASAAEKALTGPSAARSQDFLYDDRGLPA